MNMKAVAFDIGYTLVRYNNPLNWKSLYEPALRHAFQKCGLDLPAKEIQIAAAILIKYNTRENPREKEVASAIIFTEILDALRLPHSLLETVKKAFYGFFQSGAVCYEDVLPALRRLQSANMKLGVLTDVAYGMDNVFSLRDIANIKKFFDVVLTSVDVGYRKPNPAGFTALLRAFDDSPPQMIYVGDEKKDIAGANALGIVSVLIDRKGASPDFGQKYTIQSLMELEEIV